MTELKIIEEAEKKAHSILGYQETMNLLRQQAQLTREETIKELWEKVQAAHKHGDDRDTNWENCMKRIFNQK